MRVSDRERISRACRLTLLLLDLRCHIQVESNDNGIGHDVESPDTHEDVLIFKRNLLGNLHHSKNDNNVGPMSSLESCACFGDSDAYTWGLRAILDEFRYWW